MVIASGIIHHARQLTQLLPPGAIWEHERDSVLSKLLEAVGEEFSRIDQRACELLVEADPRTATEMIPDWERLLGLPDACIGQLDSLAERRTAVVTKLTNVGGQSIAYFTGMALSLGFGITISENQEFRVGTSTVGDALTNGDWVFAWEVHAPYSSGEPFRVGVSAVGDPLVSFGVKSLECLVNDFKPAHTKVTFFYDLGLIQPSPLEYHVGISPAKVFPIRPTPVQYKISVLQTGGVIN